MSRHGSSLLLISVVVGLACGYWRWSMGVKELAAARHELDECKSRRAEKQQALEMHLSRLD